MILQKQIDKGCFFYHNTYLYSQRFDKGFLIWGKNELNLKKTEKMWLLSITSLFREELGSALETFGTDPKVPSLGPGPWQLSAEQLYGQV